MENTFTFSLEKAPLFYVCGNLVVDSIWRHKYMYQKGNWEVIFVLSGMLFLTIGNTDYQVSEGCYLLVPPYENVKGYKDSPVVTEILWIHFFPNRVVTAVNDIEDSYYLATIPQQGRLFSRSSVLVEAYRVLNLSQRTTGFAVDNAVSQLLVTLSHDYQRQQQQSRDQDSTIETVDKWISAHLNLIHTNADIGRAFNFNPVYLNKLFKGKYRVSMYQYVLTEKIKRAENLLVSTNVPISEVARESYFNDKRNFSRTFKSRIGITPEAYRKLFTRKFLNTPDYDPELPISDFLKNKIKHKD